MLMGQPEQSHLIAWADAPKNEGPDDHLGQGGAPGFRARQADRQLLG